MKKVGGKQSHVSPDRSFNLGCARENENKQRTTLEVGSHLYTNTPFVIIFSLNSSRVNLKKGRDF